MDEVSHKEIYDRLVQVEQKVDTIDSNTRSMVSAFNAASGAFTVLEWLAKAVKPILIVGAFFGALYAALTHKVSP
jgi:hypothetical protein